MTEWLTQAILVPQWQQVLIVVVTVASWGFAAWLINKSIARQVALDIREEHQAALQDLLELRAKNLTRWQETLQLKSERLEMKLQELGLERQDDLDRATNDQDLRDERGEAT